MRIRRKWAAGIGVLACVGAAFWMREIASWRPVMVGRVAFAAKELRVSRDGRFLLARSDKPDQGKVFILANSTFDSRPETVRNFDKNVGLETYPHLTGSFLTAEMAFFPAPKQQVILENTWLSGSFLFSTPVPPLIGGWSKPRGEVYGEWLGEIWIWNWKSGKLKRRVRFARNPPSRTVFSPDGHWLLAVEDSYLAQGSAPMDYLRLYNVQTGELEFLQSPKIDKLQSNDVESFGFSPDSKFIWFFGDGGTPSVIRIDSREATFGYATGPVKWLPDGRIGLITGDGFEFRDGNGDLLQRLAGPVNSLPKGPFTYDWVLSPDGKWIYSAEQGGIIRRWRAR